MFRRALAIGTVSILVLTLFIGLAPILSVSAEDGPDSSPLFDMAFENGRTDYGVFSEEAISLNIIVTNTGLTPISVTVTTDSPYVAGESSKDTGTILIGRESNVLFQFNFGTVPIPGHRGRGRRYKVHYRGHEHR